MWEEETRKYHVESRERERDFLFHRLVFFLVIYYYILITLFLSVDFFLNLFLVSFIILKMRISIRFAIYAISLEKMLKLFLCLKKNIDHFPFRKWRSIINFPYFLLRIKIIEILYYLFIIVLFSCLIIKHRFGNYLS